LKIKIKNVYYSNFNNKNAFQGDINLLRYLNKKRLEYLAKFEQRLINETQQNKQNTFLSKKKDNNEPICLNNHNNFLMSVQEEVPIEDNYNENYLQQNDTESNNNLIVPIGDFAIEERFHNKIKSIFCPNFISDKKGIFSSIFENKINQNTIKSESLDCIYMHLLFPGEGEENELNFLGSKKKQIFYEIGCKIYEINKIYK